MAGDTVVLPLPTNPNAGPSNEFTYDHSNPRGYAEVILALLMLIASWITVGLRFIARKHINSIGADDYLIIVAQLFWTGFVVSVWESHRIVPGAFPRDLASASATLEWLLVSESTYVVCIIFIKLSLGYFFLRITITKRQRQTVYGVMMVSTVFNAFMLFWNIGMCGNPSQYLLNTLTNKCVPQKAQEAMAYIQSFVNLITDIILAAIPVVILQRSRLPMKVKVYVLFILLLALVGCIAAFARFFFIASLFDQKDFYRASTSLGLVSLFELSSGIMAPSIATLRPLMSPLIGFSKDMSSSIISRAKGGFSQNSSRNGTSNESGGGRKSRWRNRTPDSGMIDVELGNSMKCKGASQSGYSMTSPLAAHPVVVEKAERHGHQHEEDGWDKRYTAEQGRMGAKVDPDKGKRRTFDPILPEVEIEGPHTSWLHENDSENGDEGEIEVHSPTPLRPKPEIVREMKASKVHHEWRQ